MKSLVALAVLACAVTMASALDPALPSPIQTVQIDTLEAKDVVNSESRRAVVFAETIRVDGARWLRLFFNQAKLGLAPEGGQKTILRLTSEEDGAVQVLNRVTLGQWEYSSAFFNGEAVLVEILADPGAEPSSLEVGIVQVDLGSRQGRDICGDSDDRTPTQDARIGRVMPVGCTAWIGSEGNSCLLSAGHCIGQNFDIVQFEIPVSDADGTVNHPHPDHQYAIDRFSMQAEFRSTGRDWTIFGCHPNPNTGLRPFDAQQDRVTINAGFQPQVDDELRITGVGVVTESDQTDTSLNQTIQTAVGPYIGFNTDAYRVEQYRVDTRPGNSGSPVIHEETGDAFAIHTTGGCGASGNNVGTPFTRNTLENAIAEPKSECAGEPESLKLVLRTELPQVVEPGDFTLELLVDPIEDAELQQDSVMIVYDAGEGDRELLMTRIRDRLFRATISDLPCPGSLSFYMVARDTLGREVTLPYFAPSHRFRRPVATGLRQTFFDDFETDRGWTVTGTATGVWERDTPLVWLPNGAALYDVNGMGKCYVTANSLEPGDVDLGRTILTSPRLDASSPEAHIAYWRWWHSISSNQDDEWVIEVSGDDGENWVAVEVIESGHPGRWLFRKFRVADYVTPSDQFRIRFDVEDVLLGSLVEAGIDNVALYTEEMAENCVFCHADLDGNDVVDEVDWAMAYPIWGDPEAQLDINDDQQFDALDLIQIRNDYGDCPE
ncbi:Trypsin-like serine protease [Sulfidibacter corallicola]|uniref:Trypsin-like serine protease n=1 Tax=Sulfidibacter corallicola TaxID=2818388 RepID=A0A8A4TNK9_SULCO|nr:trypsin-like serine protease [Sulfidibacter corallicola]QTD51556.1 trypsin-like serine protease [Sulfidibacter corallicola]